MARYRKIDTRMWGDGRFRDLSSPDPSGKYLWVFLLTGPQTSNIPGLFRAGEMALAEELEWGPEGFRKAFTELLAKGLVKADWKARVVWIPNAIKYNAPDNPNVVKSWRTAWDEIPECALKAEAYERLKAFTEGLGEGFGKAFVEGCAKGLANQEQEQEQEQEQDVKTTPAPIGADFAKSNNSGQKNVGSPVLPDWVPVENWQGFVEMRQRMNAKAWTPRAMKLAINELTKLRAEGYDPTAVLDQSVMNGWKGIFPLKGNQGNGNHNGNRAEQRRDSNLEAREQARARLGLAGRCSDLAS